MTKAFALVIVLSTILIGGLYWIAQRDAANVETPALVPVEAPSVPTPTPRAGGHQKSPPRAQQTTARPIVAPPERPCEGAYSPTVGTNFGRCAYVERASYESPGDAGGCR